MIPYADSVYFGVLLYPALATVALGLAGWLSWRWTMLATLAMALVQYSGFFDSPFQGFPSEIWAVLVYALLQWTVANRFLYSRAQAAPQWYFYIALSLALLPLAVVKFVPQTSSLPAFGFLGISYITFRSLDVIFCIQDRVITTLPAGQFLTFLFFFPTISAGPIDRYRRFSMDWERRRSRAEFMQDLDGAVQHLLRGLLYKFILADLVKQYWMDPVAGGKGVWSVLSYMYAYSGYLFFDFAGYSAFAIGVSYLFGIHTPENFARPFLANNITDFWNRWHISLSTWFRDHVYMRFVIAAMKGRWFGNKYTASYLGFFLTFGLMGLWHGTAVRYLVYGLYHASLLAGHAAWGRWRKGRPDWGDGQMWNVAATVVTFHLVCFGFLIFSGRLG